MNLYRTLTESQYEDLIAGNPIKAKNPDSDTSMAAHIRKTLKNTPWISTSYDFHQMFVHRKNNTHTNAIIKIDTEIAQKHGAVFYDLSTDENLEAHGICDRQTKNFAKGSREVLFFGEIPNEACTLLIPPNAQIGIDIPEDDCLLKKYTSEVKPRANARKIRNQINTIGANVNHTMTRDEILSVLERIGFLYLSQNLQLKVKWYSINL